ncbi:GNAT family N-acetyltransferase [Pelagicoccus mobilis]|uniref:N-acetyltransferase n=1 Tax=Pelagicoccus mobilis TaxID=415221 RepID=A0A934RTP8_9BACT|nr:N-acetyltransferase [Pelagicoccus mobilis]MBK1876191.1 N-acetyltransferase [Pelagicoccus mobilis]
MIRPATPTDLPAIKSLFDDAFKPSVYESRLAERVFSGPIPYHCWVSEEDNHILACILYTPALKDALPIGYHLAPVAVRPDCQDKGYGSHLIETTLQLDPIRNAPVFVLGDPHFYERFGFAATPNPSCPYDPGNDYFRALRWTHTEDKFSIGYADAFKDAEDAAS